MTRWRVAGINFDHMHMGDLLREVFNHPDAEIAAVYDQTPERMESAIANFNIPSDRVFTDLDLCLERSKPDLAIICAATAEHADHVERVARHKVHVLVEKPFAASIAEADRMIAAMAEAQRKLAVNWPLAWYPAMSPPSGSSMKALSVISSRCIIMTAIGVPFIILPTRWR
jgi:predicted dehydrogenase